MGTEVAIAVLLGGPLDGSEIAVPTDVHDEPELYLTAHQMNPDLTLNDVMYLRYPFPQHDGRWVYQYVPPERDDC